MPARLAGIALFKIVRLEPVSPFESENVFYTRTLRADTWVSPYIGVGTLVMKPARATRIKRLFVFFVVEKMNTPILVAGDDALMVGVFLLHGKKTVSMEVPFMLSVEKNFLEGRGGVKGAFVILNLPMLLNGCWHVHDGLGDDLEEATKCLRNILLKRNRWLWSSVKVSSNEGLLWGAFFQQGANGGA